MRLTRRAAVWGTAVASLVVVPTAFAFDCTVAKKPPAAGAVGTFNVVTNEFTPLKKNPGTEEKPHGSFVVITDGGDLTTSTFLRAPQGVLPPAREGGSQHDCDGKGLDSIEVCLGG